jgi:hypothetical protein
MPDSNGTLRTSADNIAGFPDREISVAPCRAIRRSLLSFSLSLSLSLYLPRRAPFELLSPLGVVIFSKGHVEQLETAHETAIDAPTKSRGANDIEMDASYVPAISLLSLSGLLSASSPNPRSPPTPRPLAPPPRASDRRDSAPSSLPGVPGVGLPC